MSATDENYAAEIDKFDANVSTSVISEHIAHYYASTEAKRLAVLLEIEDAERRNHDILASITLPYEQWRLKWPQAARNALLALWRTPRGVR